MYLLANAQRLCFPEILSVLNFSSSLAERVGNAHVRTIITYTSVKKIGGSVRTIPGDNDPKVPARTVAVSFVSAFTILIDASGIDC